MSENRSKKFWPFFYFILLGILCFWKTLFSPGIIYVNNWAIPPESFQLTELLKTLLHSWGYWESTFGFPITPINAMFLPFFSLFYLFGQIGISGCIFSKLILFIFFILAGLSAYTLLRYLKFQTGISLIGATFYLINPFTFDWIVLGGFNTLICNYALLPWIIMFIDKLFTGNKIRLFNLILLNLLFVPYPLYTIPFGMGIIIFYFIYHSLTSRDLKKFGTKLILIACGSVVLSFFFQGYWLFLALARSEDPTGGLLFCKPQPLSFWQIIRLLNDYPGYFSKIINPSILLSLSSFLLPSVILAGIFLNWKQEQVKKWSFFLLILISFILFLQFSGAIEKNFLFMGMFRDLTKLIPAVIVGYLIIITAFFENLPKKNFKLIFGLITAVFIVFCYPFFTGDLKGALETASFSVDNSLVTQWLKNKKDGFKVHWLPQGGLLGAEKKPTSMITDFYSLLSPIPGQGVPINYRHKQIFDFWINNFYYDRSGSLNSLDKIVGLGSIKYLILRENTEIANWASQLGAMVWQRKTKDIKKCLKNQKDLKIINKFNTINIYENQNCLPLIFSPEKVYYTTETLDLLTKISETKENFINKSFIFGTRENNPLPRANSFYQIDSGSSGTDNLDLILPFIPKKYVLNLSEFTNSTSAKGLWTNYHRFFWFHNQNYQSALEQLIFTLGPGATLEAPLKITKPEKYLIFLKAYEGRESSDLKIELGDFKIWRNFFSDSHQGFVWEKIGPWPLKKEKTKITIITSKENALAKLIIIPESEFAKFKKESESFFLKPQNEKLLLLGNNEIPLQLANNATLNLFLKSSVMKYLVPDYSYKMDFKTPFYFRNLTNNLFEGTSPIEIYWQGFYKPETWERVLPSKKGYEKQLWRWMDQYGKIIFVNHYQTPLEVTLDFTTYTYKKNKTLIFWLNNKKLEKIQIPTKDKDFVINNVTLIPGINIIEIETKQNESFFDHGRTITVAFRNRPWIRENPEKLSRLAVNPKKFNWISDKNFTAVFSNFKEGEYLWLGESISLKLNLENSLAKLKIALPEKNSAVIFVVFGIAEKNSQKPFQFIIKPFTIKNKTDDPQKIVYYLNSPFILLEKKWDFKDELRNFFPNNKNLKIVSTHLLYFNYSNEQQDDHRPLFLLKDLTFFQENNSQKNILKPDFFRKLSQIPPQPVNSLKKQIKINLPDLPLEDAEIFLLNFLDFPAFFYKVTCQFDLFSSKNGENFYYEFIPDKETISESPDFKSIGFNLKNALLNKKDIKIRALTINIEKETPFVSNNKEFPPEIKIDSIIFGKSVDNLSWKEILANKILRNVPIISINGQELSLKEMHSNNPFVPQVILKKLPAGDFYQIGKISNPFLDVHFLQVESPQQKIIEPVQLIFKKIDQTKYIIKVRASRPYWLVFNETFDKNWVLLKETKSLKNHCIINGFANGWFVEDAGNYELVLEYAPEKFYKMGQLTSVVSVIIAFIYLVYPKKNKN